MPDTPAARLKNAQSWLGPVRAAILPLRAQAPERAKTLRDIAAALAACGVSDGQTLSFHHQYRNGDHTLNLVLEEAARRGLQGLTIAASSLFPVHAPLVGHMRSGVVARIISNYISGPVAGAVMAGALPDPVILQSHGGRARALETGQLAVDVAFVGASVAARNGAASGRAGAAACGPLGYAMVDAAYARRTVVIAQDMQVPRLVDVPFSQVDHVITGQSAGDALGIASGTTRAAQTGSALAIADQVARVIRASGLLGDGFTFQTGAGGLSLATVPAIGQEIAAAGLQNAAVHGGITGAHVDLLTAGVIARIRDVQCFDIAAVASAMSDPRHTIMSASDYASPLRPDAAVNDLDVVVLGAAEVDRDFNVNVARTGDGRLIGGPGGHPDTAAGAKCTIIVTTLTAGGWPKLVESVGCITTPGQDVDVVVTEAGIAVAPHRPDLAERLRAAGLPVVEMEALIARAAAESLHRPVPISGAPRVLIEAREGHLMDTILSV